MRTAVFQDRQAAGRELAKLLAEYAHRKDVLVLALPRGGVPVGYEVAKALDLPLDVFIVRKLGVPGHQELAMGAVASGGAIRLNEDVVESLDIPKHIIASVLEKEEIELKRREGLYRKNLAPIQLEGKVILLIDDGLATGASISAACEAIAQHMPSDIVVAAPVASSQACDAVEAELGQHACICALTPEPLYSIGAWYRDFHQVEDSEVIELLERGRRHDRDEFRMG